MARIGKSTFYGWLKRRDNEASGLFRDLMDVVRQVEAQREMEALAKIYKASGEDWRAAAWYLAGAIQRWGNGKRRIVVKDTEPSVQEE
jgi:hypothetical protein